MTIKVICITFATSKQNDRDKQLNTNTTKKQKQMAKNQVNGCPDYIIKEFENVLALMEDKEDYLYNTTVYNDEGDEEYDLETEYEYLRETYESLKAGHIRQNLNYFEVLSNFLYIYVKSLEKI